MKVIIVGDIHGRNTWEKLRDKADKIVFVGDYFDTRDNISGKKQLDNFISLTSFKRGNKDKVILLLGNHCHGVGTDILSSDGWIPIEDAYLKAKDNLLALAQFDINSLSVSFNKPTMASKGYSEKMKRVESRNISMLVTDGHDLIYKGKKTSVKDLENIEVLKESDFPLTGNSNTSIEIEDSWIRLLTWIIMDGTIVHDKKYLSKKRIQFHLAKKRKIEELKKLLEEMNIPYTLRKGIKKENRLQDVYINIYGQYARDICIKLDNKKQIPKDWAFFSKSQLVIFLDTLIQTDGYLRKNERNQSTILWATITKNDIDIVSQMCIKNNYIFRYKEKINASGFKNGKLQYQAKIQENKKVRGDFVKIKTVEYSGNTYCFTMPLGTLITRYNGKIAFAGNCYQYLKGVDETYSGYQPVFHHDIREALEYALKENLIEICYEFSNNKEKFLVSHAGVSPVWLKNKITRDENVSISKQINDLFLINRDVFSFYQEEIKYGNRSSYGENEEQSPIWIREASLNWSLLRDLEIRNYKQIIGHTMVDKINIDEYPCFIKIDSIHNNEYLIVNDDNIEVGKII
jgi:hypothetical protein